MHRCSSTGVESRLAALTVDTDDLSRLSGISNRTDMPSTFQPGNMAQLATTLPAVFNMLHTRRAIIPAANGHCSGRALARYYAALVDGGVVPLPHSSSSRLPLGSHPHIPKFPPLKSSKKRKACRSKEPAAASKTKQNGPGQSLNYSKDSENGDHSRNPSCDSHTMLVGDTSSSCTNETGTTNSSAATNPQSSGKIFSNPRIHDEFLGIGDYGNLAKPDGKFGLGFKRYNSKDGSVIGFGHSGMGGSTGYCDVKNRFAIAVTLNKMSFGAVTARIIQFVCSELNIPPPEDYSRLTEMGADTPHTPGGPLIN
ncbi:Beta-lactamase/transpeptidase-like [Trema orientale]|uniref:Beta-lactamase/transpeptidase-like n=1 Tax=Trema orientale TaxID=63057 RepID=A0A2P5G1I8_TREOI|nr:Beta-lactamase/transpeptidase-like [Trema orientale]